MTRSGHLTWMPHEEAGDAVNQFAPPSPNSFRTGRQIDMLEAALVTRLQLLNSGVISRDDFDNLDLNEVQVWGS